MRGSRLYGERIGILVRPGKADRRGLEKTRGWWFEPMDGIGLRIVEVSEEKKRSQRERIKALIQRVIVCADCLDW